MSSAMELLNNKGTFLEQKRLFRTSKKVTYRSWRDQSPKRSSSRPRSSSKKMIQVRIKKMDKSKTHIKDKLIKKKTEQQNLPEAPHNTTQFIIDVNNHDTCANTPNIYGEDHDQFQFSFAHHPMAGSMMSMMSRLSEPSSFSHNGLGFFGEKFTTDNTDISSNCEENHIQEDNRLVNSISSEQETDLGQGGNEFGDYSQYLRQCEAGGDLQETVRNLVELLKQKDQQIEDMKSIYN